MSKYMKLMESKVWPAFKATNYYDSSLVNRMKVVDSSYGKLKCELKVTEDLLNIQGSLHGGCTATMIDAVSSFCFLTMDDFNAGVSLDMNISYMKGAKPGEKLTIESSVLKDKGTIRFADVHIKNEEGQMVACGKHTKSMNNINILHKD